uniref:Protein EE2 n=1 Tax=Syphacia muris TaxID=451379 RepID=A0A0N5A8H3_9BILA
MTDDDNNPVQYRRMSLKDFTGLESHAPQSKVVTLKEFTGLEDYAVQTLFIRGFRSPIVENETMERQMPVFVSRSIVQSDNNRAKTQSESATKAAVNNSSDSCTASSTSVTQTSATTRATTATNSSATPPSTSLIDSFSIRRRSMISCSDTEDDAPVDRTDMAPSDTLFEELSNSEIIERLNQMRSRLSRTINDLPNESPKKKQNCSIDKTKLLDATRCLNGACKAMVQAACEGKVSKRAEVMNEVIECADKITSVTEKLIVKSDSVFEAELASAKTDQMLKALLETVICLEKAEESGGNIESASVNELIAKNTALSANISQLLESFYRRSS